MADTPVPQTKTVSQRMDDILFPSAPAAPASESQPSGAATSAQPETASTAPAAGSTPAAARRLLKLKLDHEEKEIDLDAEYDDEGKRKTLAETYQKGYVYDRALERARTEEAQKVRKAWNEFAADHQMEIVEAPGTKWGWKMVPKQVTTPAAQTASPDADPLTKEEAEIRARIEAADVVDWKDLDRLSDIKAERAKLAAIKEYESRTNAATQAATAASRYEEAKKWMNGEIGTLVSARTKSFEGVSERRMSALRQQAFAAGEAAAKAGQDPVAAAKAVIFEEANDLDAIRGQAARQPTPAAAQPKPNGVPVVGTTPGGASSNHTKKDWDTEANRILGLSR